MDLSLYSEDVFSRYKSASQRIRVLSERWFDDQMYCPACSSKTITRHPNNKPVLDFFCPDCGEQFQLKSQSKAFTGKVTDGAYKPMVEAFRTNTAPNFFFLHYSKENYSALNLLLVPRFFLSESTIEKRNALSADARRSGFVGCNILFKNIAQEGRIQVIEKSTELSHEAVRESWRKISFLKKSKPESKGWINDILWCINQIGRTEFSLKELSVFEGHLKELHPDNNNIEAKIRQQLQFLRNKGYLNFVDNKGNYNLAR